MLDFCTKQSVDLLMQIDTKTEFNEAAEEFLLECMVEGKSPATLKAYRQSLVRYVSNIVPDVELSARETIIGYLASMTNQIRSGSFSGFRDTASRKSPKRK